MELLFETLKNSGAKLTAPRRSVLTELFNSSRPLTLKELHNICKLFDFASIYRSIKLFKELGIVEEISFADKKTRYEIVTKLHHHHIICSICGEIKELPICLVSEIEKLTNYQILKHSFEFMGICPDCKT